jgi:cyclophilin family peptidyl-prolyl cis-trans isomerase/HEAT repeat protein
MLLRKAISLTVVLTFSGTAAAAQRARPAVTDPDVTVYARLLEMTDTRRLDMPLVERSFGSKWRPLRAAAALAVGQVGSDVGMPGAPRLHTLVADADLTVAANAAYALGLLRDTSAVGVLANSLNEKPEVALEAAWSLGEIGAPARNAIVSALNGKRDPATSVQLLFAASKLRPVPFAAIQPYLRASHPAVVWAAAYAVARTRSPAGVRALIDLESSPVVRASASRPRAAAVTPPYTDPRIGAARIRGEIARALAKSAAGDSLGERALTVLGLLATDSDPHVRINAIRSIATYGAAANAPVVAATRDVDANVRIAAAQSLGSALVKTTDLTSLWNADTSIVYRSSLLASATRVGLRPAELATWASNPDWRLRAAVANAGGDTLDRAFAISRNLPLLKDPDARVREAAYGAILPPASIALEDSVHAALVAGLRDSDFYVRATILSSLGERPSSADLDAVLASYSLARGDSANDARLAAVQYVAALWKKDSTSFTPAVRSRLTELTIPGDPLERAAAKGVPTLSSWTGIPGVARPLAWYVARVREQVLPASQGRPQRATIRTVRGPITLELFGADAPITVYNFLSLARSGYYRNTRFHRVVPNFVAQDGDPRDDGNGGPGYAIRDEMNRQRYERGAVGMALSGPDTGGSQYFVTHSPQPHLDGHYTVFGRVVGGYDVLDRIVQGDLIMTIESK